MTVASPTQRTGDQPISTLPVSVIIPTHNRARLLPRAARSVLNQTFRELELIVVDDASSDDTRQVVAALDDPRVRYIRHDRNRGAPEARNTGIEAARGKYIAFQDSDDEWLPEKLEKQMAVFKPGSDADVVYCSMLLEQAGSTITIPGAGITVLQGDVLPQLLAGNFVSTQTLLLRRECLEKVGGFDTRLPRFQDWELVIRLAETYRFQFVNETLVRAYETPGNISSNNAAGARAMEIILEKHRRIFNRHPAARARHLFFLGNIACLEGSIRDGRAYLFNAVKLRPWRWKTWSALALTLLGPRVYRAIVSWFNLKPWRSARASRPRQAP